MAVSMDACNQHMYEDNYSMEVLASFVNIIDEGTFWWHDFPIPSRKDFSTQDIFPNANNALELKEEAMAIFWAEAGWMKKKGTKIVFS